MTTKKTAACHNIRFVDRCSTAGLVVADDDDEKDGNGNIEGDDAEGGDMTRGEWVNC